MQTHPRDNDNLILLELTNTIFLKCQCNFKIDTYKNRIPVKSSNDKIKSLHISRSSATHHGWLWSLRMHTQTYRRTFYWKYVTIEWLLNRTTVHMILIKYKWKTDDNRSRITMAICPEYANHFPPTAKLMVEHPRSKLNF